jgi:hypothetical protein
VEGQFMSQVLATNVSHKPWYKEPWPWFLAGLPAVVVVASFFTLYVAVRSDDGLVAENYYTQGLAINRVLDMQKRATDLGMQAQLRQEGGRLVLALSATRELTFPPQIHLSFLNPARAGSDQTVLLRRVNGDYVADMPHLRDGRWNLKLEDEGGIWQLFAETRFPLVAAAKLRP